MTNDQLKIDWLKNARFVWEEGATEVFQASETEEEPLDAEASAADLNHFFMEVQDRCKSTSKEGREAVDQKICSLYEAEKLDETKAKKLKDFVDQLGEKFLNTLAGGDPRYKTKDFFERYQLLQGVTDWEAIMERFEKAETYKIKPHKDGLYIKPDEKRIYFDLPARIVFVYPEGKKEMYPLELYRRQGFIQRMSRLAEKRLEEQEAELDRLAEKAREASGKGQGKWVQMNEENRREMNDQWREKMEDLIARTNYLRTSEDVHQELRSITTHLPDELLEKLSTPLSKITQVLSNAEVDYGEAYKVNISDADAEIVDKAEEELEKVLEDYLSPDQFPDDMDEGQLGDILKILEEFQLD